MAKTNIHDISQPHVCAIALIGSQGTIWYGDDTSYTGDWVDGLKHGSVSGVLGWLLIVVVWRCVVGGGLAYLLVCFIPVQILILVVLSAIACTGIGTTWALICFRSCPTER